MALVLRSLLISAWLIGPFALGVDTIGLAPLRALAPGLVGTGVSVAQPEAGSPAWEVNPAAVAQPQSLFTWISSTGTAAIFPNTIGLESGHADAVAGFFYGAPGGVAPDVAHVDNYEAGYFYNSLIHHQTAIAAKVVNQSFIFGGEDPAVDRDYDAYAARYNTLFVSGAGNGGSVSSPATCYNGIGVGVTNAPSSFGPTADGRSKPDLVAAGGATSFSTPLVAGAAALLAQAGALGDGGTGTAAAAMDARTIKALLLTGAVKPSDWTNSSTAPLDARYGAGVVNVFGSYLELRGGKHAPTVSTTVPVDGLHPPPANTNSIPFRRGWDFNRVSSTVGASGINHYFFDLSAATNAPFNLAATLQWFRQVNQTTLNNLDLFLFNADNNALVASSQSLVDNTEHLFVIGLAPGRYDLQVLKNGGVRNTETYALAFDFGPPEPPRLSNAMFIGGQFQFRLFGEPNQNYVILATTDLSSWTPIRTNSTSVQGFFDFSDPQSGNWRFYQASWRP